MQVLCPFCEGQGEIFEAIISATKQKIYICGECDTVWQTADISEENCQPFDCFMLNQNLKPLWNELKDIKKFQR